jgi:hypothetical protein
MTANLTLEFLGAQMERMFAEQAKTREDIAGLREDMRVLTAIVLRHENTMVDMLQQIRAMVSQHSRFNDRLRRLRNSPLNSGSPGAGASEDKAVFDETL